MHIISWLERKLEASPQNKINTDELFFSINEELCAAGQNRLSKNTVGRILNSLFHIKSSQVREHGVRRSFYIDVKFREEATESVCELSAIRGHVAEYGYVSGESETAVTVTIQSGLVVNHHTMMFNITFYSDNTWTLHVGDLKINLEDLNISSRYETSTDVLCVLNIVKKLRLCQGKEKPDRIVIRSHVVERCSINGATSKCVRTEACKRVLAFSAEPDTSMCRPCQKVKLARPLSEEDFVVLDEEDSKDLATILDAVMPEASVELKTFILEQQQMLKAKGPNGHRWSRRTIQLALTLWTRNPAAYEDLKSSGFIRLPSMKLLRLYKNAVPQDSGLNPQVLHWMLMEAQRQKVPSHGMRGGILFDEMSIEEDIQTVKQGKCLKLVGFVDCGSEAESLRIIKDNSTEKKLANHALQFQFLGYSGFRFPFAHFATLGATATELYILFWDAVAMLKSFGIYTDYANIDGAITNRQFLGMNFPNKPAKEVNYRAVDRTNPNNHVHIIMDIKHSIKKIRNNILNSSADGDGTRLLKFGDTTITWSLWREAYEWDRKNPVQIHNRLTHNHIHLDGSSKMRNHLAEECLNEDMLQMMLEFKESLGQNGRKLDGAIEMLKKTSLLVSIFNDRRLITEATDQRLKQLSSVQNWFKQWEKDVSSSTMSKKEKRASLMSYETRDDLDSSVLGFVSLCKDRFKSSDFHSINPSRLNSDSIENNFCQQRGIRHGNNANPTYNQYKTAMNSIILGQGTISTAKARKSNAWKRAAEPYSFSTSVPLVPKLKRKALKDVTNTSSGIVFTSGKTASN